MVMVWLLLILWASMLSEFCERLSEGRRFLWYLVLELRFRGNNRHRTDSETVIRLGMYAEWTYRIDGAISWTVMTMRTSRCDGIVHKMMRSFMNPTLSMKGSPFFHLFRSVSSVNEMARACNMVRI
jgi:hypothetical protein